MRYMKRQGAGYLLAVLAALAAGCAGNAEKYDRPLISTELEERTGHAIGPGTEPGVTTIPDGVATADGISEDEGVAVALWNNAAFQEAISELGFQRAELIQAGLLTNPVFSILFPLGPKQLEFTATFPVEALLLRPRRMAVAELDCERAGALLVEHGLDLVCKVQTGFAELELARERLTRAEAASDVSGETALLQEVRLSAGDVSEMEVAAARVRALEERVEVARLARECTLVENRLLGLLGLGLEQKPFRLDGSPPESLESVPELPELLHRAGAARPDVRAAELSMEAAGERAGLASWEILKVSALVDANEDGDDGFEIGPGMAVEVPIFDQGQGRRARTSAELERTARHYITVRHEVALGVREAHARLLQALEGLESWRTEIIPAVVEAVRQAERAYDAGATSPLDVLASRERLIRARITEAVLAKNARVARAELERQVGCDITADARKGSTPPGGSGSGQASTGTEKDHQNTRVEGHVERG